jgi:hypothetical protein
MRRRGRPRRSGRAGATTVAAAAVAAGAVEARGVRATAGTAEPSGGGGRRRLSVLSERVPRLVVEAVVVFGGLALAAGLIYQFTVHHIHNPRPLGGVNVDVSRALGVQTEATIAADPRNPRVLLAASNDDQLETLRIYSSSDGGARWTWRPGPAAPGGSCAYGNPRVAIDGAGREYVAFLVGSFCGDDLTPYLVVGERDAPSGRWHLARVTPYAWKYGFDDGPALATDPRTGTVYVAFERGLAEHRASMVLSRSSDHGRTWSAPVEVSKALDGPHLASIAVAEDGDVYLAGIDGNFGVWVTRSSDGGRSFVRPRSVARLAHNPAPWCARAGYTPIAQEARVCIGPDPTLLLRPRNIAIVWGDGGANGAGDVFAALLDRSLRPLARVQVNPPDGTSATQQILPVAAVDASTGVLWACWYDTTFDPHAHRTWFTCSASRNGRVWTAPERAASEPTDTDSLLVHARHNGFYPALAAAGGEAHPLWIDGRRYSLEDELFTAAIHERAAFGS